MQNTTNSDDAFVVMSANNAGINTVKHYRGVRSDLYICDDLPF